MKPVRQFLPLFTTASGHLCQLQLFRFQGQHAGPTVHIQAALHASEVQGVAVVHQLAQCLENLDATQLHGTLYLLPLANPHGINMKIAEHTPGPFHLEDGSNWNRCFRYLAAEIEGQATDTAAVAVYRQALINVHEALCPSHAPLAQKHADVLMRHLLNCDLVFDLHTSTCGSDFAYVPYEERAAADCGYLGVNFGLRLPNGFGPALDEAFNHAWSPLCGKLKDTANMPRAYTLEYGGQEEINLSRASVQADHLLNFLRRARVLHDQSVREQKPAFVVDQDAYVAVPAPHGGLYQWHIRPGTRVRKDEPMATLLKVSADEGSMTKTQTITAPMDGVVLNLYPSAIVHEGAPLVKMIPYTPADMEAHKP